MNSSALGPGPAEVCVAVAAETPRVDSFLAVLKSLLAVPLYGVPARHAAAAVALEWAPVANPAIVLACGVGHKAERFTFRPPRL